MQTSSLLDPTPLTQVSPGPVGPGKCNTTMETRPPVQWDGSGTANFDCHLQWFCVRSQPKHEHIAAANLKRYLNIDVFSPRFRFRKPTSRGPVWTIEPVFPGYLFACFDLASHLERVKYAAGVSTVVHFGDRTPVIHDEVIAELRTAFGCDEIQEVDNELREGDEVTVACGSFCGLTAVVLRTMSSARRVRVLIEFLGSSATLDLPYEHVEGERKPTNCLLVAN